MKKLIFSFILLLYSTSMFSTAIVIYITPGFVIMGADSKGLYANVSSGTETSYQVSKIYQHGKIYFAMAGIISNNVRGFDVAEVINRQLKSSANIVVAISNIKLAVKKSLLQYLTYMKSIHNAQYRQDLAASVYITSAALICIRNNKPYAHILGFKVRDGSLISISVEEQHFSGTSTRDAVYYLGQTDAINEFMDTVKKVDVAPGIFVENLIKLQIAKTPAMVGGPIDIIYLEPGCTTWLKRKKGTPVLLK